MNDKKNTKLNRAKAIKNDEFYTLYEDIEKELKIYTEYFENKIIYCNCDNPKFSNFWKYYNLTTLQPHSSTALSRIVVMSICQPTS